MKPGEIMGIIADPFGLAEVELRSEVGGIVVGRTNMPVVNEGEALFHIAEISKPAHAEAAIEGMAAQMEAEPLFDEDEII